MATYKICGCSQTGESHIQKDNLCQDFSSFKEMNGIVVAAVADGLGSSKHSDIASRIAAQFVVDYCLEKITSDSGSSDILLVLRDAFDEALFRIKNQANGAYNDYDTTLSAAVFISGDVYTGQVGDSAIIALREDGLFDCATQTQNGQGIGKDRPTFPLGATDKWVFEKYQYKAKALFLATDGMLNKLMPPLLENQKYPFDNRYLSYLFFNLEQKPSVSMNNDWINEELSLIEPNECNHDDKSLIIIFSNDVLLNMQADEYYQYPNNDLWNKLLRDFEDAIHPNRQGCTTEVPEEPEPKSTSNTMEGSTILSTRSKQTSHLNNKTHVKYEKVFLIASVFVILLISVLWFKAIGNNSSAVTRQEAFAEAVHVSDAVIIYDGNAHGLVVEIDDEFKDANVKYGLSTSNITSENCPMITDVRDSPKIVYYTVSCEGYKDIKGRAEISILPFDFADLIVGSIEDQFYCAKKLTPELIVSMGDKKLTHNEDYRIEYKDNTNAGVALVHITPTAKDSNYRGEKTVSFEISKAELKLVYESESRFDINDTEFKLPKEVTAYGANDVSVSGGIEWFKDIVCSEKASEDDLPQEAGEEQVLYFKFTPSNKYLENYQETICEVIFIAFESETQT